MNRKLMGDRGEKQARRYLEKQGLRFLCANYRALHCEIDLIMQEGDTLVFVEVKTRTDGRFGSGREAVDYRKQKHIVLAATQYLQQEDLFDVAIRFDVVEIDLTQQKLEHIRDAFRVN